MRGVGHPLGIYRTCSRLLAGAAGGALGWIRLAFLAQVLLALNLHLAVNLLSAGQQELADRFAGRTGIDGEARFGAGRWTTLVTGAPILEEALVSFDCRIVTAHEAGTHTIFIARVLDVIVRPGPEQMVYVAGRYGWVDRLG